MESDQCKKPILIVEGQGDVSAIPVLVRSVLHANGIYDVQLAPRPKTNVEVRKLSRAGEIERYVEYCNRDDGDSILIAIDCDDFCPLQVSSEWACRIRKLPFRKPVAICLFRCEYEAILLPSINIIANRYPAFNWNNVHCPDDIENIRDVKGLISNMMPKDRAYKETRDQARFTACIDLDLSRSNSRSFRHFEKSILWLAAQQRQSGMICPSL
jgi:hypothetical protein